MSQNNHKIVLKNKALEELTNICFDSGNPSTSYLNYDVNKPIFSIIKEPNQLQNFASKTTVYNDQGRFRFNGKN